VGGGTTNTPATDIGVAGIADGTTVPSLGGVVPGVLGPNSVVSTFGSASGPAAKSESLSTACSTN
jgi:hypothetical protein